MPRRTRSSGPNLAQPAAKRFQRTPATSITKSRRKSTRTAKQTPIGTSIIESNIAADDLCPICQHLLYDPVITQCRHHLCSSCMTQWADISSAQMIILDTDIDHDIQFDKEIVRCPMCRSSTTYSLDKTRTKELTTRYPSQYARIKKDLQAFQSNNARHQTVTLYIGHRHARTTPSDYRVFIKPSQSEIIEEIQFQHAPSYRVIRTRPPYEVTINGPMTLSAHIILKAGYSWISDDAVDSPDGAAKGTLPLEWTSSSNGKGCTGYMRLQVMQEGGNITSTDLDLEDRELRRDRKAWERTVREYLRDGLWSPDMDDED